MKITKVEAIPVSRYLFAKVHTDEGITGVGESGTWGYLEASEAAIKKFLIYLNNQREGIVDYEAYQRRGCIVGSGFVEKLNDTLIKSRMVHGKRMRWSLKGGEAMMALLSAKHNGRLAEVFA
jgi:L-alanine-DL-glutamate epimerase-like enolase superfamily enzyme